MILPDQTPKLPKWPFLVGDAALLGAAGLIASESPQPLSVEAVLSIVACVVAAGIAGAIPFLADYARRQDEALDNRQRALEALARDATTAAEQISIAAAGLRDTADSAEKSLGQIRQLPGTLQAQLGDFRAESARLREEERLKMGTELAALRSSLSAQLEAAAARIALAAEEWIRASAEAQKKAARVPRMAAAPVPKEEPAPEAPPPSPQPAEAPSPALLAEPAPAADPGSVVEAPVETPVEAPAQPAAILAVPAEPLPEAEPPVAKPVPRKRAPRKAPRVEPEAAPTAEPSPAQEESRFELEAPPAASEFTQSAPDEVAPPSSLAADGASRLLVTAYIGIGNRLFIRGDGPGLSWEKGVPLQFVSIGKWRWDTGDATAPIAFRLLKNDEIECSSLGTRTLEPGHQVEVTATF
jgi:hypothetical protein